MNVEPDAIVLWNDTEILVVNKPAGLLSLPDGYDPTKPNLRSVLEPSYGRLWIVHRLDRETSGVMVLARTAEAHRELNIQFEHRKVEKVYHALVVGTPTWEDLDVKLRLRANGDRRHRTIVDPEGGKPAETTFRVLRQFAGYALVEAIPKTGRPHQIRAHSAAHGHPVVADSLYGKPVHPAHGMMERHGLHAFALTLKHPRTGDNRRYEAPHPADFATLLTDK